MGADPVAGDSGPVAVVIQPLPGAYIQPFDGGPRQYFGRGHRHGQFEAQFAGRTGQPGAPVPDFEGRMVGPEQAHRQHAVRLRSTVRCARLDNYFDSLPVPRAPLYDAGERGIMQVQGFFAELIRLGHALPVEPRFSNWCRLSALLYKQWLHHNLTCMDEKEVFVHFGRKFKRLDLYVLGSGKWVVCPEVLRRR